MRSLALWLTCTLRHPIAGSLHSSFAGPLETLLTRSARTLLSPLHPRPPLSDSTCLPHLLAPLAGFRAGQLVKGLPLESNSAPENAAVEEERDLVAFLQYTSGSTADPKGVMVTHSSLAHNVALIAQQLGRPDAIIPTSGVEVSWLPQYHDMGLIGGYLVPMFVGATGFYMSPLSFLRDPLLWLRMISEHRGTHTQAPDFAYALCARRAATVGEEALADLDLSSMRHAFNAADTVRGASMDAFLDVFGPGGLGDDRGFNPKAFSPGYGLAEHTVYVTDNGGTRLMVDRATLEERGRRAPGDMEIVGCGVATATVDVKVVNAETRVPCEADEVGEIWVSSESAAAGYWGKPELSKKMFKAVLSHPEGGGRPNTTVDDAAEGRYYLRTGDLGFLSREKKELFFVGRSKDVLIVRGRNHAPQDIERSVEFASVEWNRKGGGPCLRRGSTVAFATQGLGRHLQRIVVAGEVDLRQGKDAQNNDGASYAALAALVRTTVAKEYGVAVDNILLLQPRSVPRTTSGKLRRNAARISFEKKLLQARAFHSDGPTSDDNAGGGGGLARAGGNHAFCTAEERSTLRRRPQQRRADLVERLICRHLERSCGVSVPPSGRIAEGGADSMVMVEMQHSIQRALEVKLPTAFMVDHETAAAMGWAVAEAMESQCEIDDDDDNGDGSGGGDSDDDESFAGGALAGKAKPSLCTRVVTVFGGRMFIFFALALAVIGACYQIMTNRRIGWYRQEKLIFAGPWKRKRERESARERNKRVFTRAQC